MGRIQGGDHNFCPCSEYEVGFFALFRFNFLFNERFSSPLRADKVGIRDSEANTFKKISLFYLKVTLYKKMSL